MLKRATRGCNRARERRAEALLGAHPAALSVALLGAHPVALLTAFPVAYLSEYLAAFVIANEGI